MMRYAMKHHVAKVLVVHPDKTMAEFTAGLLQHEKAKRRVLQDWCKLRSFDRRHHLRKERSIG